MSFGVVAEVAWWKEAETHLAQRELIHATRGRMAVSWFVRKCQWQVQSLEKSRETFILRTLYTLNTFLTFAYASGNLTLWILKLRYAHRPKRPQRNQINFDPGFITWQRNENSLIFPIETKNNTTTLTIFEYFYKVWKSNQSFENWRRTKTSQLRGYASCSWAEVETFGFASVERCWVRAEMYERATDRLFRLILRSWPKKNIDQRHNVYQYRTNTKLFAGTWC